MSEEDIRNFYPILDEIDPSTVKDYVNMFDKKRSLITKWEWSETDNIWKLISKEETEVKLAEPEAEFTFSYTANTQTDKT